MLGRLTTMYDPNSMLPITKFHFPLMSVVIFVTFIGTGVGDGVGSKEGSRVGAVVVGSTVGADVGEGVVGSLSQTGWAVTSATILSWIL
jgi:hypothetical protein